MRRFLDASSFPLVDLFVGGEKTQAVKCWDVRARRALYELSTGNNTVAGLAWSDTMNTLFTATSCEYVDRMGYHDSYRRLRLERPARPARDEGGDDPMDEDSDESEGEDWDENDDEERYWPDLAYHNENDFREPFDLGEHSVCECHLLPSIPLCEFLTSFSSTVAYQFREDADPKVIPEYGQGTPESNSRW